MNNDLKALFMSECKSNLNAVTTVISVIRNLQKSLQRADLQFHEVSEYTNAAITALKESTVQFQSADEKALAKGAIRLLKDRNLKGDDIEPLLWGS